MNLRKMCKTVTTCRFNSSCSFQMFTGQTIIHLIHKQTGQTSILFASERVCTNWHLYTILTKIVYVDHWPALKRTILDSFHKTNKIIFFTLNLYPIKRNF